MCGIAGLFRSRAESGAPPLEELANDMSRALLHRGPDAGGVWCDQEAGIALGHRRLSILDLSPAGRQPMESVSGRYVLSFNGEIYNHLGLRATLERAAVGREWRGRSDTETMLACFDAWGLEASLRLFSGMFAFALWDKRDRTLHLAVDRLGEKPLYYGWMGGTLLFGSELKALKACPGWKGEVDRNSLVSFLRFSYIPAPRSIYRGVQKLSAGTFLTFGLSGETAPVAYWSAMEAVRNGRAASFRGSPEEAVEELDRRLRRVVAGQMEADVPLGAFLSGGVDSSTIVALMQAQSSRPVKTFTIGFNSEGFNEAQQARAVARHLGTNHTELILEWSQALSLIPRLPTLYDEPFADSSQIPTFLVAQLAREHVKVSLTGDGGDELFGGYNRHSWGESVWKRIGWIPRSVRKQASVALSSFSTDTWEGAFRGLSTVLPKKLLVRNPGEKIHKLAENMDAADPIDLYRGFVSHWHSPGKVVLNGSEPPSFLDNKEDWPELPNVVELMLYLDLIGYLPGDILTKVDRAAMGVSLESRVPFLDHSLVEFAWSLPLSLKLRESNGKWILRQVLYKYVPKEMVERPKMGFAIPLQEWLRGPLRDWAESLLSEDRLRREGYFNPFPIRRKWEELISGKRNWAPHMWDILMFQAWLEANP